MSFTEILTKAVGLAGRFHPCESPRLSLSQATARGQVGLTRKIVAQLEGVGDVNLEDDQKHSRLAAKSERFSARLSLEGELGLLLLLAGIFHEPWPWP